MLLELLKAAHLMLEKAARPGVLGMIGQKVEKSCARDMTAYFEQLKRSVEKLRLEERTWDVKTARHVVTAALHNVMRKNRSSLETALRVSLMEAYLKSTRMDHFAEAMKLKPADVDKLGDFGKKAAAWAAEQAGTLVTDLDAVSVDRIASAVEQGITQQLGAAGTGRLIREELDDMVTSRALTIAATEINRAMSAATLDKLDSLEVKYKQWILDADPCEICIANNAQGAIPVDDSFDSGDDAPPAHPNCRCAVAGARGSDDE